MIRRITTPLLLLAIAAVAMASTLFAGPAEARTHHTREGVDITLTASKLNVRKVAPLDASPLSGDAFLASNVHAALQGIEGKTVRATVEVGYKVGYPVSIAPNGVKVTAHTPELKLSGGVNAKIAPEVTISGSGGGGKIGEIGAEAGAEATVIPSADMEFEVGAGKVTNVTLAEIALTKPVADIVLSGIEINTSNAIGPIAVRPFAKISVTTDTGVYVYYDHGPTSRI
ncbi:MspA family porin [Gordonia sp. HY002]|uniref:MspA family porin n=1 Tax=Gordonia zhenghanii TaxID=2911516 RepID=UPI001EF0D402|nr:MspA family porin [Gordonia zhenghanii]MCF8570405.1 MspA family porin [Gordonia zhenghanii]MCF8604635.1 MspA family porin [Gordonia zhenghanii]